MTGSLLYFAAVPAPATATATPVGAADLRKSGPPGTRTLNLWITGEAVADGLVRRSRASAGRSRAVTVRWVAVLPCCTATRSRRSFDPRRGSLVGVVGQCQRVSVPVVLPSVSCRL